MTIRRNALNQNGIGTDMAYVGKEIRGSRVPERRFSAPLRLRKAVIGPYDPGPGADGG